MGGRDLGTQSPKLKNRDGEGYIQEKIIVYLSSRAWGAFPETAVATLSNVKTLFFLHLPFGLCDAK